MLETTAQLGWAIEQVALAGSGMGGLGIPGVSIYFPFVPLGTVY